MIFIFRVKKEFVLFVFLGYIIVIIVSNIILKRLYKLNENILEPVKIIKDNKIPCRIEYINTLEQVCKSCDVIRFAENSFLFEKQFSEN